MKKTKKRVREELWGQSFRELKPRQQIDLIFDQREINEEVRKAKRREAIFKGIKKDTKRKLNEPMISKHRKTTKSRGRQLKVSAQAGIRGFWR